MQGNHPSAPGQYADPHDRGAPHRTLQPGRKAPDAAEQKTNQGRGKDVERKSSFPSQLANPRKLRGIRTFPPPLRLLIYETGHFICYQKRTFLLANDNMAEGMMCPLIQRCRSRKKRWCFQLYPCCMIVALIRV